MKDLFSETERARIEAAVAAAEQRTSGEIVPFIVPGSGDYDVAVWRGAALGAMVALGLSLLIFQFYEGWGLGWLFTGWGTALWVLGIATLGALLTAFVAPLKRLLAGQALMTRNVHLGAMAAFVEEEVFKTRDRTGILIFVSLFEHRIEVLGDAGINEQVEPEDWVHVVERIRDGIKKGDLAEGIVEAFGMCGELLEGAGVALRSDDVNELSDEVRFRGKK